jgi:hypothetical protein
MVRELVYADRVEVPSVPVKILLEEVELPKPCPDVVLPDADDTAVPNI